MSSVISSSPCFPHSAREAASTASAKSVLLKSSRPWIGLPRSAFVRFWRALKNAGFSETGRTRACGERQDIDRRNEIGRLCSGSTRDDT
ncbi:unnamed protein product [Acanthoscelides obtectus]|uniref:Uncharacterized protein n=1 Tax=Acanthoscelides obtectus TaxID=200917 RepID=A0A9P0LI40_ACAOB|nr:unnamed protein product [Acanthoscelides obtectus]CAK1663114.1 hypothetical protein AOBTE_LOCUS23484 [Acanthoscelides obtectus]